MVYAFTGRGLIIIIDSFLEFSVSDETMAITKIAGLTWDQWNARLALPLLTQLREGTSPLVFPSESNGGGGVAIPTIPALSNNDLGSDYINQKGLTNGGRMDAADLMNVKRNNVTNASHAVPPMLDNSPGEEGLLDNSNGGGYTCGDCGRNYKLKSSLRNHQKWECGKEPQFKCPFCDYRAKQKMHIGRHMGRMHKDRFVRLNDDQFLKLENDIVIRMEEATMKIMPKVETPTSV